MKTSIPLPVVLLAPLPAFAQNNDIIVTATGVGQSPAETGQAVTIVDRALIDQRQTIILSDLLATTPGITVTRNGGIGGFTGLRVRGAEAEQTLVLIDGVRVNDPSSPGGGFDFGNLLSGSIDRVELLRGPDSVAWGSRAIGGVVNIVTRAPTTELKANASAEYGYANGAFANAGLSGGAGPVTASLTGGYLRTDGISAAADGRERDGFRQYGATGRANVTVSDSISLDLRGYYAHSRTRIDGFPPPAFVLADTPEYSTAQEVYGYAGVNAAAFGGRLKNRLAFTIADINRDNFDFPGASSAAFIGRGRTERYEYQADIAATHKLRVVLAAEHENSRFSDGFTAAASGITSGFGQAIWRPAAPLTLTGGIRYDSDRTFGGHLTYAANGALALHNTVIRASYAEGFKAPTLYQRFSFFGDRDLKPETARSYDVGVEQHFLAGRARAGVTYFNRRTTNQIDFDLGTFTYANIARTSGEGVEAELTVTPVQALLLTANYSYIDTTNLSPGANFGNVLARRPRQAFNASIDYRTAIGLALGATVQLVGDSFDNQTNSVRIDGYAIASVRAEMPVGKRLVVYGRIDNLADAGYRTVAGYGTYPRAAYGGIRFRFD